MTDQDGPKSKVIYFQTQEDGQGKLPLRFVSHVLVLVLQWLSKCQR